jgi:hypothetical protein
MVSINHEDKIQFIKDDLSKDSLDNLLLTFEMHPIGDVHHDLWPHFFINNMVDIVFEILLKGIRQFLRKLDRKPIPTHKGNLSCSWM